MEKLNPYTPKLIGSDSIWDCESSLYDSFELKSFQRRLDSATHARSLSLPHLGSDQPAPVVSKLSRTLKKVLRSVLFLRRKSKKAGDLISGGAGDKCSDERRWLVGINENDVVYDKKNSSGALLSTIPESPEAEKKATVPDRRHFTPRSFSMNAVSCRALHN